MKNIFVIPTKEPSQIYLIKDENTLGWTTKNPESMEHYGSGTHNQHVYITNKDPYVVGDWVIDIDCEEVFKVAEIKEFSGIVRSATDTYVYDACYKIILTTDFKLVADGIEEIQNEILWSLCKIQFGSLESAEVEKIPMMSNNGRALYGYHYKLIIPKAEPNYNMKQEIIAEMERLKKAEPNYNMKQEIIAEMERLKKEEPISKVAESILANNIDGLRDALNDDDLFFFYKGVILNYGEEMVKWQQENSNINALDFEIDSLKREIKVLKHRQEKLCDSEAIQRIRATLSDAEARRIIRTI
jgi:hypothetical protein